MWYIHFVLSKVVKCTGGSFVFLLAKKTSSIGCNILIYCSGDSVLGYLKLEQVSEYRNICGSRVDLFAHFT